jgi:hypothetical protein
LPGTWGQYTKDGKCQTIDNDNERKPADNRH